MRIDIWSDVVCPFCYLGKKRFEAALDTWPHADQVEVVWHSFELDPAAPRETEGTLADNIAKKYSTSIEQSEAAQAAIAEQFGAAGSTFNWQIAKPGNTLGAHRAIHLGATKGKGEEVMAAMMRGYFTEGAAIGDREAIVRLAASAGLDETEVREALDSDAFTDAVRQDEAAAQRIGISGVPFFVFDDRLAVSGAQPTELFTRALNQAWDSQAPEYSI